MKQPPRDPSRKATSGSAPRQQYKKPTLTEYGSIAKLTQGTRTNQSDGVGGGFKMTCL
jgi:hypothetical protein